jgi:hypothetical protein
VQNLAKTCKKEKPIQVAEAIEWEVGAAEITGKFLTGGNRDNGERRPTLS